MKSNGQHPNFLGNMTTQSKQKAFIKSMNEKQQAKRVIECEKFLGVEESLPKLFLHVAKQQYI